MLLDHKDTMHITVSGYNYSRYAVYRLLDRWCVTYWNVSCEVGICFLWSSMRYTIRKLE